MKRLVYYACFTALGAMVGFFLHMVIEITYTQFLLADFARYGFGWSWQDWDRAHAFGTAFMVLFGTGLGYRLGVRCWEWLYVRQGLRKRWGITLKGSF